MKTHTKPQRRASRTRFALKQRSNGKLRLSVFRSSRHMHAQIIDDASGKTLAAASTLDAELKKLVKATSNADAAKQVGALIAKRAKDAKIDTVVFDRGQYIYHGRVKAVAEGAREGGLKF